MIVVSGDRPRRLLLLIVIPCFLLTLVSQLHVFKKGVRFFHRSNANPWQGSVSHSSVNGGSRYGKKSQNSSFHLVVVGSERSLGLCRTLLSAAVLGYPPPVLLDATFTLDIESDLTQNTPDSAKIVAIDQFLQDGNQMHDEDILLIVESSDSWFQLPHSLMIDRFQTSRDVLSYWYGLQDDANYPHSVVFASSDQCQSMKYRGASNTGCKHTPKQPITTVYEAAFNNSLFDLHQRYLNASAVIGKVNDTRALYARAAGRLRRKDGAASTSANLLTELLGEQEFARKTRKALLQASKIGFLDRIGTLFSTGTSQSLNDMLLPEGRYEFGIGLDYISSLFHVSSGSHNNIAFRTYAEQPVSQRPQKSAHRMSFRLPSDIGSFRSPISTTALLLSNKTLPTHQMPYNLTLDRLPANMSWHKLCLATDGQIPSVPALLLLGSEQQHNIEHMWSHMWFHPWARALLRASIRSSEGTEAARLAASGKAAHAKGGQGGVWFPNGHWMEWGDVCGGFEEELFGDGMGPWGKEGGGHPEYNRLGLLISGEE